MTVTTAILEAKRAALAEPQHNHAGHHVSCDEAPGTYCAPECRADVVAVDSAIVDAVVERAQALEVALRESLALHRRIGGYLSPVDMQALWRWKALLAQGAGR